MKRAPYSAAAIRANPTRPHKRDPGLYVDSILQPFLAFEFIKCLTMPPMMELSTLVKSFIVFLKLLGCLVAVKADPACSFEDRSFPIECTCLNYTITCDRRRLPPPKPAQIPRDVHDLTITGYVLGTLNTTELLGVNLTNLTRLTLSGNGITDITRDSFRSGDFPVLETLVLGNNEISLDISETLTEPTVIGGLVSLPNLRLLDLSGNGLGMIRESTLKEFDGFNASIIRIDLSGNPFVCDCDHLPLVKWLKETELVLDKELLPCKDTGVKVVNTHIKCTVQTEGGPEGMSTQYVFTLSIIFAIIGILAIIILFMRRNDIWQFCLQVRQATKEAFDSHQTHYQYSGIYNARRETADSGVAPVDV